MRSDWTTPIEPAKHAMKNDVKPASRAAASAGTTWKASVCASRAISGATSTPSPPRDDAGEDGVRIASWFGDRPESMAETSFSDAALVDSPKGVQRYSAASAAAATITIPARIDRPPDDAVEERDRVGRQDCGRRLRAVAEDEDHAGLQNEEKAERRGQLRERRRVPEWAEDGHLDRDAERGHADERQDESRYRVELEAEVAGLERPVEVRGQHRDRADRDVDDPRPR